MKKEPLENKRMDLFYKTNDCDNCVTHSKGDFCRVVSVKSAVEWLKKEIKTPYNKVDCKETDLFNLIDKAFPDLCPTGADNSHKIQSAKPKCLLCDDTGVNPARPNSYCGCKEAD